MAPILIAGVGNCLLKDDGVGVHAVRMLALDPPPHTSVLEVGTDFLAAVSQLKPFNRIFILDAMEAGRAPGTVYLCRGEDVESGDKVASLHQFSLRTMIQLLKEVAQPQVIILGIQPGCVEYGKTLSPNLAELLPAVVRVVRRIVAEEVPSPQQDGESPFYAISV